MMKRLSLAIIAFAVFMQLPAKVRLPRLIGDNMILQQDTVVSLWGWTNAGKTVTVSLSWTEKTYTGKADKEGRWMVKVQTPKASFAPLSITFDDGEVQTVSNVLAGEVWVCAGQSNMKMTMSGYASSPIEGYNDAVAEAANLRGVHYIEIPKLMSATPLEDTGGEWVQVNTETVGGCCAVGYYFARLVSRTLNIPVGLISANQGGTRVEAWMNKEYLERYTDEPTDSVTIHQQNPSNAGRRQLLWYNGTFHPILCYTVKGILYYQGESNVNDPGNRYSERLSRLVRQWREEFGLGDIPFYQVEIAPFANKGNPKGIESALLREQQYRSLSLIPNSALISTNDLVYWWERNQIHPSQKRPIGERLAYTALHRDYGMKSFVYQSPNYKSLTIKGDTCFVEIDTHSNGMEQWEDIEGFEVAGEDHIFHPARAIWKRNINSAIVISDEVSRPISVRYCFRNFQAGNFRNMGGLPLLPFRTDDWDENF